MLLIEILFFSVAVFSLLLILFELLLIILFENFSLLFTCFLFISVAGLSSDLEVIVLLIFSLSYFFYYK